MPLPSLSLFFGSGMLKHEDDGSNQFFFNFLLCRFSEALVKLIYCAYLLRFCNG
jgi:hypothetical protein